MTIYISRVIRIFTSKGGECLSDQYINAHHKLKWQCQEGHIWEAAPFTIKKGHWCPDCQGRNKHIEEIQKIAIAKGGKLISKTYKNNRDKLTWECAKGHIWEAPLSSIQPRKNNNGSWCPECHGTPKKTIEQMKLIATERGGKCLSSEYFGANTKLKWECDKGHYWDSTPSNIINGNKWCPVCSRAKSAKNRVKYSIKDMQNIAKQKGGDCLSKEYISFSVHLKWQCEQEHEWKATPKNILKGRWCPECAKKKRVETRKTKMAGLIGIGRSLTAPPSHTTGRTGPYPAVRLIRQDQIQGNKSPSDVK